MGQLPTVRSAFLRPALLTGAGVLLGLTTACGPNCQSSCQRIYSSSECNIAVAGFDSPDGKAELIRQCVDDCDYALRFPGELGDYNPNERHTSGETITLANEEQAAAWMDCIDTVDCSQLNDGFCAPI